MKLQDAPENQIGLGKRIGVADGAQADTFRRPRAETFDAEQRLAKRCGILIFGKRNRAGHHAPAEFADRVAARDRGSNRAQVGVRQDFGCGKPAGVFSRPWMRDWHSIVVHQLADQIGSLRRRNQLAQDRTNCRFKRIPSARQPQPRMAPAQTCEQRNSLETLLNQHGITIQIEHFSYSPDDSQYYLGIVGCDTDCEVRCAAHRGNADKADDVIDAKRARKRIFRDSFEARDRMRLVEAKDAPPIVG